MTTKEQWHRIKWSFLSRLPEDTKQVTSTDYETTEEEKATKTYLPFFQKVGGDSANPLDTGLHISNVDANTQEIKALKANESHMPSDTDAIAESKHI